MYNKPDHICTHVRFGLRGCTRLKGHIEQGKPHFNMFAGRDSATWNDEDGMYVNNQEEWVKMVDTLGSPDTPMFDTFK